MGTMQWIYSDWLTPPDRRGKPGPFYPWPEDWLRPDGPEQLLHPGAPEFEEFGLRAVPFHDPTVEEQPLNHDQP